MFQVEIKFNNGSVKYYNLNSYYDIGLLLGELRPFETAKSIMIGHDGIIIGGYSFHTQESYLYLPDL